MAELIVYLEPISSSSLYQKVQHTIKSYKTTASKYSCHVTMTGFFTTQDPNAIHKALDETLKAFHHHQHQLLDSPVVSKPILVHETEPLKAHLLLPITVSDDYHRLLTNFKAACDPSIELRLKKVNHISLAYWDEPNATEHDTETWYHFLQTCSLQQSIVHDFDHLSTKANDWNIVLYQRTFKGEKVGEKHQFKELARWSIQ